MPFLDACRAYNSGELEVDGLREKTVQLGNVIDGFDVVDHAVRLYLTSWA